VIAAVAAATSRIRVGSVAVQTGHQTALGIVEQFGILDALYPGRIDLGLGRSGQRNAEALAALARKGPRPPRPEPQARVVDGLLVPKPFSFVHLIASPKLRFHASLISQPGAESPDYPDQVDEVLAFLAGAVTSDDGVSAQAVPGAGADVEVWIFGSSGGQSARVAGERGLPFAANYHVSPGTVLAAADAYRAAFAPSARFDRPHLAVSADVVVAADDATARRLAEPYGLWVRGIRTGEGAAPFPSPEDADAHVWTDEDRELVADRVDTQFVGTPAAVAERLATLARVTGADELVVTTITHDHDARCASFELLAREWGCRG
jgi:alkanesulfonate monooxygenase SsuD/methylene tetrahydromethanopterin reductase-like flavin-dependent oxidoreductase (luciferase family)